MANKTKIIATIGPSSNSRPVLKKMISAGMNVARLNFSHGSYEDHVEAIKCIRSLSREMNKPVAILADLQGPKIRTGKLKNAAPVILKKNQPINITTNRIIGTAETVSTTYSRFCNDVKKGNKILIDDGLMELKVLSKNKNTVKCKVITGGVLKENKGINLPGVKVTAPSLTAKDKRDVNFGIKTGVDYFALSFVRCADDISSLKAILNRQGADIPVIAKIEKPEAVDDLDKILEIADAIMVARGDLGVELSPEKVPTIQKNIISQAIQKNRIVITATQMLETMTNNPVPTRAEASDVANAIFDGTDAIMLSGETASGKYPIKAVQMMTKIAKEAEKSSFMKYNIEHKKDPEDIITHAVAQSSVNILHEIGAKAIAAFSVSGKTSKLISKQRPFNPVYAFTPLLKVYNRMGLIWGVTPVLIPKINNITRLIEAGERMLIDKKFLKEDDLMIFITGLALKTGSTNLIKIHRVGHED